MNKNKLGLSILLFLIIIMLSVTLGILSFLTRKNKNSEDNLPQNSNQISNISDSDLMYEHKSYTVKNVNEFGRGEDTSVDVVFEAPVGWEIDKQIVKTETDGSECFEITIKSAYTSSKLQITYVCQESWDAKYTNPSSDSEIISVRKEYFYEGGNLFLVREKNNGEYIYGEASSEKNLQTYDDNSYYPNILINEVNMNNHDFLVTTAKIYVDENTPLSQMELDAFDKVIETLYME